MKTILKSLPLILICTLIVCLTGCDLGTYEQRAAEPYGSKFGSGQPAVAADPEGAQELGN